MDIGLEFATWGTGLGRWLLMMTGWTAAIVALAVVLDRVLRRKVRPGVRMVLYAVVFVRLWLPADFASPVGVLPGLDAAATTVAPGESMPIIADAPLGEPGPSVAFATPASPPVPIWGAVVAAVYLAGVTTLLLGLLVAHLRLRRALGAARPSRGFGDLRVLEHPELGPLALGCLRPTVVLPSPLLARLAPCDLNAIVRHEHAHLLHGDPWVAGLLALATVALWPVVPVWIAARRLRDLMELRADEAAVRGIGSGGRDAYRKLLVRLASERWQVPALSAGFGPVASLEARLAALAKASFSPLGFQLALCGSLGAILVLGAAQRDVQTADADADVAAATDEPRAPGLPDAATQSTCPMPPPPESVLPTSSRAHAESDRIRGQIALLAAQTRRVAQIATVTDLEATLEQLDELFGEANVAGLSVAATSARMERGQVRALLGDVEGAINDLGEGAWLGASTKYDAAAAEAAATIVVVAAQAGDYDTALSWARHAKAALKRLDQHVPSEPAMWRTLALIHERQGQPTEAAEAATKAAAVSTACGLPLHPADAQALFRQAQKLQFSNPSRALTLAEQAYNAGLQTQIVLVTLTNAACTLRDQPRAASWAAKLTGKKKEQMTLLCRSKGVDL